MREELLDVLPPVMRFVGNFTCEVPTRLVLSVPQFRAMVFLRRLPPCEVIGSLAEFLGCFDADRLLHCLRPGARKGMVRRCER